MENIYHSHGLIDILNSPTGNNPGYLSQLSTPKMNKSLNNSKSPLGHIKLKKSKRRECTPAYSPKKSDEAFMHEGKFCLTEKKTRESQRLNFDSIEVDNCNLRQSFVPTDKGWGLNNQTEPKRKFLSLIEESLSEVSDQYYGILGSQSTPDVIFKNIFSDEKKSIIEKNSNRSDRLAEVLPAFDNILREINNKKQEICSFMKTQIVYFDNNLCLYEVNYQDFFSNLLGIQYDLSLTTFSTDQNQAGVLYVPGTISLLSNIGNEGSRSKTRLIFEVNYSNNSNIPNNSNNLNNENIPTEAEVRLAIIEIYP